MMSETAKQQHDTKIIDGLHIARILERRIAERTKTLQHTHSIIPALGVILVEGNEASRIYVNHKMKIAESIGISARLKTLPPDVKAADIARQIEGWNNDPELHGILLQLPLPEHIDSYPLLQAVAPQKDMDALNALNAGKLFWEQKNQPVSCTPMGCLLLLESVITDFTGLHAVVVGASQLVGRPMAQLLLQKNCTVTNAHIATRDLVALTRQADILVVATGSPGLIRGDMVKPGAAVIDVGITRLDDGRITGDVCFDEVKGIASALTPVPGGVGPMTIACLMANTLTAAEQSAGIKTESVFALYQNHSC